MSDDIQRIKRNLSVERLAQRECDTLNEYGDYYRGDFPGHARPSSQPNSENFSVSDREGWYCFRHEVGGGPLEWIAVTRGYCECDDLGTGSTQAIPDAVFREVLEEAAAEAGVDLATDYESDRPDDYPERRGELDATMERVASTYHGQLDAHDKRDALKAAYGFSDELIDRYKLGYCPPDGAIRRGDGEDALYRAGLLDENGRDFLSMWNDDGRWTFPYWVSDRGERAVRFFTGRACEYDAQGPKYLKLKTDPDRVDDLVAEPPFGADSVRGARDVVLTEGVTDALSLIDAGFAAVAPVTTNISGDALDEFAALLRGKTVYAVFDEDAESQAGLKGAARCAQKLDEKGVDVHVARLPARGNEDMDVNDYLMEHTAAEFRADVLGGITFPARVAWWAWGNGNPADLFHSAVAHLGHDPDRFRKRTEEVDGESVTVFDSVTDVIGEHVEDVAVARRKFYSDGKTELSGSNQKEVYAAVLWWYLNVKGAFFTASDGQCYYYYAPESKVYVAGSENVQEATAEFRGLIESRLGITAAQWSRSLFDSVVRRAVREAPEREAHRFAAWNGERGELYVTDFESGYYVLDGSGGEPEHRRNGTDVFFLPDDVAQSYHYLPETKRAVPDGAVPGEMHPFVGQGDLVHRFITNRVNYDEQANLGPTQQRAQLYLHLHSIPFVDHFSSYPIMAFVGKKGSGKTVVLRSVGRFFYGENYTEAKMRDDEKDFIVRVANHTLVFADNYDDGVDWANDALASIATGANIEVRELYTTAGIRRIEPECFIAITSRDPPFRRDDVADRCLVFRVQRVESFIQPQSYLKQVTEYRDSIWSAYLDNLDAIVREMGRKDRDAMTSEHRMADWAVHAKVVADALGVPDVDELLATQQTERAFFALEDDSLRHALEEHLRADDAGGEYTAQELLDALGEAAKRTNTEFAYRRPSGLGSRLKTVSDELGELFGMEIDESGRTNTYRFPETRRTQYMLDRYGEESSRSYGPAHGDG